MPLPPSFRGMGQARPISQDEEVLAHALNYSQAAIIGLRNEQRMTQEATNAVIAMVSDPQEFGGDVWIFDGYQKPMDGDQSIPSSIVKEIFGDPQFAGCFTFSFEPTFSEYIWFFYGWHLGAKFCATNRADKILLASRDFVDASCIKVNLSAKSIYCKCFFWNHVFMVLT